MDGVVEANRISATLGGVVRTRRRALRLTQSQLGERVGLAQSRLSDIERGRGVGLPLEIWVALGIALGQPLAVSFSRPTDPTATSRKSLARSAVRSPSSGSCSPGQPGLRLGGGGLGHLVLPVVGGIRVPLSLTIH